MGCVEEALARLERDLAELRAELIRQGVKNAVIEAKLNDLGVDVRLLIEQSEKRYVPFDRYIPVERIVYGAVGIILLTILGALLALVVIP